MAILTKTHPQTPAPIRRPPLTIAGFVELCARSNFSFLQGASHPEEMVEQAIRLDYQGLFLSDLNGLYGVVRGFQSANSPSFFTANPQAKADFRYGFGTELTVSVGQGQITTLTLIPLTKLGYRNLCQLLTLGKRSVDKGFSKISLHEVIRHSQDLLLFCEPEDYLELRTHFARRIYIPVWRDLTWESTERTRKAFALENLHGAELFVTQKPFMHLPERKIVLDVLTCILHHKTLPEAKTILLQNSQRCLRSKEELYRLWADRPELVSKTVSIADQVAFSLREIRYRYPASQLDPGQTPTTRLEALTQTGLQWRYPHGTPLKVQKQVLHELRIIAQLEYEDYFLTLAEICDFARAKGILYQGRGSAANSVVCFALGLTSVDPAQFDLLFERFLSVERAEPPDIDIDFEHERREEVLQHIYAKYNEHHAAMVCTVIRYKSRMSLREAAKVFAIPLKTVNALIKFMGRDGMRRLLEDPHVHRRFGLDDHTWKLLLAVAQVLNGFPRHLGIHTGGFLITQDPITEIVPVEKASMHGRYVIQWNKDDVNFLKLMKIDLLSLGMLSALRKALTLLRDNYQVDWNLAQIPGEDPKTYQMICQADTVGVFQIESRAQMQTLPRLKPKTFYDLVVEVALVRPGPLQGGMVHPYLRRREGLEKPHYPHPNLIPVLQRTLGVPIFQEQVMKIVVVAAGFSPGEADELRRVMSMAWRKKGTMEGVRLRILRGLRENGIADTYCEQIYKTIEGFANYGFPESHAASFALLTYASCYIKCHYPAVFTCALLNSQPMGFYAPRVLIADAQRHGVEFLPLDVQSSNWDYSLTKPGQIRTGLRALAGVPQKELEKLVQVRASGVFASLQDLIKRTQLPRSVLAKLAAAGALSSFHSDVRQLLWQLEAVSLDANSFLWGLQKESFSPDSELVKSDSPHFAESNWESLHRQYEHQGFSLDLHPLGVLRCSLNSQNEDLAKQKMIPFVDSQQLVNIKDGTLVRVAGLVSVTQRPPTAKGMCFITLEDEFGFLNIVVPPDVYQKDRLTIYGKSLLEIRGRLQRRGPLMNIQALRVFSLLHQGS